MSSPQDPQDRQDQNHQNHQDLQDLQDPRDTQDTQDRQDPQNNPNPQGDDEDEEFVWYEWMDMTFFYGRPDTYDTRPFWLPYADNPGWPEEVLREYFDNGWDKSEPGDTMSALQTSADMTEPQTGATSGEAQQQIDLQQASGALKGDPSGESTIDAQMTKAAGASTIPQDDPQTDSPTPRQVDGSASELDH